MLKFVIVLLLVLSLAGPVWAQDESMNPAALRQRLEGLLLIYTEEHPDVRYTRRLLEKAEAMEAEKQAAREARRKAQERDKGDNNEMNHVKE